MFSNVLWTICIWNLNSLPNDNFSNRIKLKAFADDKQNAAEMLISRWPNLA